MGRQALSSQLVSSQCPLKMWQKLPKCFLCARQNTISRTNWGHRGLLVRTLKVLASPHFKDCHWTDQTFLNNVALMIKCLADRRLAVLCLDQLSISRDICHPKSVCSAYFKGHNKANPAVSTAHSRALLSFCLDICYKRPHPDTILLLLM